MEVSELFILSLNKNLLSTTISQKKHCLRDCVSLNPSSTTDGLQTWVHLSMYTMVPPPRFIVRIKYIKHSVLFMALTVNTEQVLGMVNIIFSGY